MKYFVTLPIFSEVGPHLDHSSHHFNVLGFCIQFWSKVCMKQVSKVIGMSRA